MDIPAAFFIADADYGIPSKRAELIEQVAYRVRHELDSTAVLIEQTERPSLYGVIHGVIIDQIWRNP